MPNPVVVSVLVKADTDGVAAVTKSTTSEIQTIEKSATSANTALAKTTVLLNGQRTVIGQAAAQTRLQSHEVTNLTYQLNDMATMLASGQSPFVMMMQQGPQVSQILGQRGLGQIIPALGQGLMSLVTPVNLLLAGLLAVGYAGAKAWRMIYPEVEPLNDVLKRQASLLAEITKAYDAASNASGAYGGRSIAVLNLLAEEENKLIRQKLRQSANDTGLEFGLVGGGGGRSGLGGLQRGGPVSDAYRDLQKSVAAGNPDFKTFQETLTTIAADTSLDESLRAKALAMIKFTEEAARAQQQLSDFGKRPNASEPNISLFRRSQQENEIAQKRMMDAHRAALFGADARSPQEQAAAARAAAASQVNSGENPATRAMRIELAGTIALAKANLDLKEAQRGRLNALKDTMAAAELDLSLIGKSASEVARLKMEHQLLGAAREAAALAGVQVDEKELALIREKAAAYAQLKTLTDARTFIAGKNEELAKLRLEQQLIGATASIRSNSIAIFEAEIEIRKRGLDVQSDEAEKIRANAKALASVTLELDRQRDAWGKVQSAGESALDLLVEGDFEGALKEVSKTLLDIAVKNPLKNAVLGTEHGTLQDLGGFGGLFAKLFGGANDNAADAVASALGASSVASMNVTAASVVINGGAGGLAQSVASLFGKGGSQTNSALGDLISGGGVLSAANSGNSLRTIGNFKAGVDERLMDILNTAAQKFSGYQIDAISGFREGDSRFHGKGMAADVQLTDLLSGRKLGNYQDAGSFREYEKFAQMARQVQMEKYPELAKDFRWGGYFSGGKGKYGAMDQMHFDLGGRRVGMGGGSFAGGLNDNQRQFFPDAQSSGMNDAVKALQKLGTASNTTTSGLTTMAKGLDGMGSGLTKLGQNLSQASVGGGSSGGGIGGFFSKLFGGIFGGGGQTVASVIAAGGGGLFSEGGDVWGAGTATSDSIDAKLSNGEFVVRTKQANKYRPLLRAINNGTLESFAGGGSVGRATSSGSFGAFGRPQIQFINQGTPQRVREERDEDDGQGGRKTIYVLEDMVASSVSRPGSPVRRALGTDFGLAGKVKQR